MKSLRELAKGYSLLIGGPGEGASPWGIWKYDAAPTECFADAKPEEPVRKGDRVVFKERSHLIGSDADFAGQHGTVVEVYPGISTVVNVLLDGGTRRIFWRNSLRRERDDERPAGITISGDEAVAAMNPDRNKPPPRKYEDGQHIKTMQTAVRGTIERAEWGFGDYGEWVYYLWPHNQGGDSRWTVQESACVPCPPPLSEAQRMLQPGDKVRVREKRWDANGRPLPPSMLSGIVCVIQQSSKWNPPVILCRLTHPGEIISESDEFLHNLDPVEGGGA